MGRAPRTAFSWNLLREELKGSFDTRSGNLLGSELALLGPEDDEFGRLRLRGLATAEFESGEYAATLTRSGRSYRMVADNEELLTAVLRGGSLGKLEISCGNKTYEAKASFFRNLATASYPGSEEAVRICGGLAGRSYRVRFAAGDARALPVAIFLLWHLVANRRRAYRMGNPTGGEQM